MIVAIDGPAGVGKSSVARRVASSLGFQYVNSGSFYRAVTWAVLRSGRDPADPSGVLRAARECRFDVHGGTLTLDGASIEEQIHTDAVDAWVAVHSSDPAVRDVVNARLRQIAEGRDVVVDGRDIGSVVFPRAEVKIFRDADVETRAARRFRQGTSGLSLGEIQQAIAERDRVDRSKAVGRLDAAEDALRIDTSHLTIDEVCERVNAAILVRKNNPGDTRQV
jgi:cytidylate kinase